MNWIKILSYSFFLFSSMQIFSVGPHAVRPDQGVSLTKVYHLIDLGEPNADADFLSAFHGNKHSSPKINNEGDISANGFNGAILIRRDFTVFEPCISDAKIIIHGMNDLGDLLVKIDRGKYGAEWNIWLKSKGWSQGPIAIGTREVSPDHVFLAGLNDRLMVVGNVFPDGKDRAVLWTPSEGMWRYTTPQEPDLSVRLLQINNRGTTLGSPVNSIEKPPFIINGSSGLICLEKYRSQIKPAPDGRIEFPNFVLGADDIVYGNFWINEHFVDQAPLDTKYLAFKWIPKECDFKYLDLKGMRIADVNSAHCLVGSWEGKAAFCNPGTNPVKLSDTVLLEGLIGWDLLEATSINDAGQIVGFGKKEGAIHLFLANPLPN